jgi:hypothetical protein
VRSTNNETPIEWYRRRNYILKSLSPCWSERPARGHKV